MDKETFKILKHILKTCESKAKDTIGEMAERAEKSKNRLFESLKGGSFEDLIELHTHIMADLYKLADKVDAEAENGSLGINNNDIQHLSEFVANIQVERECNRLIQEKLDEIKANNKKD